jgi:CRISPR-associated protein Cst1
VSAVGANLRWTGHALVDIGVAGVCAFAKRERPEEVTLADLDAVSDFLVETYYQGKLGTYLSCVFMNASFVQPKEGKEKREEFIAQYLRAHRAGPDSRVAGKRCVFSGQPATSALVRTHLPLFSGEGVVNFRPNGETWVPAAGPVVVAVMFLPMSCRRSEGRMLGVLADDPGLTLEFARRFLEDNRRLIALALPTDRKLVHEGYDREQPMWDGQKKRYKFADVKGPRSFVVTELSGVASRSEPTYSRPRPVALSAYLISNSGQGPSLEILDIPSGAVSFVLLAVAPATRGAWQDVAKRFRPVNEAEDQDGAKPSKKKKPSPIPGRAGWTRNSAFEDLCEIFDPGFTDRSAAARWLRRHVLGRIDSRAGDSRYDAVRSRSWALAELFLREVMGMKQARIDAVRGFADKLALWIHEKNDRKLERALFMTRDLRDLRRQMLRAQSASAAGALLFGLDEYATVWLHEDGDQYLVRDLVCIRVVERLHELGRSVEELDAEDSPADGKEASA